MLRLMDRRAKLNGLDAPAAVEVSGPGGGAVRLERVNLVELNQLLTTAGDPDPDEEDDEQDPVGTYDDADLTNPCTSVASARSPSTGPFCLAKASEGGAPWARSAPTRTARLRALIRTAPERGKLLWGAG